jgi:hypothetical protein
MRFAATILSRGKDTPCVPLLERRCSGCRDRLASFLWSVTVIVRLTVWIQWQRAIGSIKSEEIVGLLVAERNNVGLVLTEKSRVVA